jgi:hypothetical protein
MNKALGAATQIYQEKSAIRPDALVVLDIKAPAIFCYSVGAAGWQHRNNPASGHNS